MAAQSMVDKITEFPERPGSDLGFIISELCDFQSSEPQFPHLSGKNDNSTLSGRVVGKF